MLMICVFLFRIKKIFPDRKNQHPNILIGFKMYLFKTETMVMKT